MAGVKAAANFRPGPESSASLARCDFQADPATPIAAAKSASAIHTATHRAPRAAGPAAQAATSAVEPIRTPPRPGTAVNEPARSMVWRMYRKLSIAWACSSKGCGRGIAMLF
jgi:hypothetical protein